MMASAVAAGRHQSISGVILTYNEELNLSKCLESIADICNEIHIVDSGSVDSTIAIARRYTQLIHHHSYVDHPSQLAWALTSLPFTGKWLLVVDADNVVTPQLGNSILEAVLKNDPQVDAYYADYRQYFRGKRVRGFKSCNLTLFRRSRVSIDDSELVDGRLMVRGTAGRLDGSLLHSNAKESDIDFWIDKHQRYAFRAAVEETLRRHSRLKRSFTPRFFGNPDERITWLKDRWYGLPLFVRPFLYFAYRYFFRLGFLDGMNGLTFHFLHALWYRFLIDAIIRDLNLQLRSGATSLDSLQSNFCRRAVPTGSDTGGAETP